MSIIDTLITDRIPGAAYDWHDMNRVAEAMEYVAEILRAYGHNIEVSPQRFTRNDRPTPTVFAHYLGQLEKLRGILALFITTPPVPGVSTERPYMTVQEANDIERILLDIDRMLNNIAAAWFYSGEIYAGEFT